MWCRSHSFAKSMSAVACLIASLTAMPVGAVVTEDLKLVPDDGAPSDDFGNSVAVSGGWAVVGSPKNGVGGAAYIFDTVTGQQLQKLAPIDLTTGAQFGRSIAVDGSLAVIGAHQQGVGGAVYVFDLNTGNQLAKLVSTDVSAGDLLGLSVAISDGIVVAGAPGNNDNFNRTGSVYTFDVNTGNQLAKLNATIPVETARLGIAVAFDGGLVAAYDDHVRGPYGGVLNAQSVSLFDPWTGNQIAKVLSPDSTLAGSSVAIRGDRLLIGAPSVFPRANAGIYDIADTDNISERIIRWPGQTGGAFFGSSVALNDDVALISTWFSQDLTASGIVYMFDPDTGTVLESFRSSDGVEDDRFGTSIGLDGQTLIVGSGVGTAFPGTAYLFTIPEPATLTAFLMAGPVLLGRILKRSA